MTTDAPKPPPPKPPPPPQPPPPDAGHMPMTEEMDGARWTLPSLKPLLIAAAAVALIAGGYYWLGKAKLERTIGDLGLQSGLIARTREDLEALRRKGDRNYFEFTLLKGKSPTPISTVSLQLKKADQKRSKFTLNVMADDRTIEKKDKTMMEPLQFYTGRDRKLYEVVIFTVEKNKVTGYMSTPKSAPAATQ